MGGAAAANPVNTMSMATNPAAISNVDAGYDVGLEVFNPTRGGTNINTGVEYDGSDEEYFVIPESAWKMESGKGSNASFGVEFTALVV